MDKPEERRRPYFIVKNGTRVVVIVNEMKWFCENREAGTASLIAYFERQIASLRDASKEHP